MGLATPLLVGVGAAGATVAVLAGTVVLVLMLVALAGVAYRGLRGDGIRWPGDERDDDEVRRASDDEEWKYY